MPKRTLMNILLLPNGKSRMTGHLQLPFSGRFGWEQRFQDPQFQRSACAHGGGSNSPAGFPSENSTQLNFLRRLLP